MTPIVAAESRCWSKRDREMRFWRLAVFSLLALYTGPASAQVVVLAHPDSGNFVVIQNRTQARTEAMRQANAKGHNGGWKLLLSSSLPGHGAMFCFRPKGEQMRYFIAEGKPTAANAIVDARTQANAAASGSGAFTAICGSWNNRNTYALDALSLQATTGTTDITSDADRGDDRPQKESEHGLIETIKHQIREQVTCVPEQQPCTPPPKPAAIGIRG